MRLGQLADEVACVDWEMTVDMLDNLNQVRGPPAGILDNG